MQSVTMKSFTNADETRTFDKTKIDIADLGTTKMVRLTLQPGWRWSQQMKPIVGTDTCRARHVGIAVSGSMGISHTDGTKLTVNAGDAYVIEPGHDAWISGSQPFVGYEVETATVRLFWKHP